MDVSKCLVHVRIGCGRASYVPLYPPFLRCEYPDSLFPGMNITRATDSDSCSWPRASAEFPVATHCLRLPEQTHQQCLPTLTSLTNGRVINCPGTEFGSGAQQEGLDASMADADDGSARPPDTPHDDLAIGQS